MEMTLQEYNSKIFTIIENAIYNYEVEALVEAAEDSAEAEVKKAGKLEKLNNVISIGIRKVFDALLAALGWIIKKLADLKGRDITLTKDIKVHAGTEKFDSDVIRLLDKLRRNPAQEVLVEIDTYVNNFYNEKLVEIYKGARIKTSNIMGNCKKYEAYVKKLNSFDNFKLKKDDTNTAKDYCDAMKKLIHILQIYTTEIRNMIAAGEDIATKNETKVANAAEKNSAKLDELKAKKAAMSESVEDIAQLRANLLIEAARLLQEDADDYVDGIDGGENLYDDEFGIDKTVAKDDEYPADDVTGGKGIVDDDDIKDLVNNDAEALKILKDDEPAADPQTPVTESVIIRF